VRLPFPVSALERVLAPLEHAHGLPAAAYVDEAVFALEREALFSRSWICVGRECEVSSPGEFILAEVAGEEIVVVRGPDLELHALCNVCRHRGLRLVDVERGRVAEFVCPYHGWSYELGGALRAAPFMPATFRREEHGLVPAPVGTLHGFVFVSLASAGAEAAEPLASALGGAPEWLARPELAHLRLGRRVSYETSANWKLCIENFQESHHFQRVHPALERLTPSARATTWQGGGSGAWLGGFMELAPGATTVALEGGPAVLRGARPSIVPDAQRRRVADAMAFPVLLTSLQPDYLLTYHLSPRGPSRTGVVAKTYFHARAFNPTLEADDVFRFWDRVNAEDRAICERQQRGVGARAFDAARYSLVEEGVLAFDQRVARVYLAALS